MSERDEDGNERFLSLAPLSVRGPFSIFDNLREQVSKDRLRYRMDGFNLDLRYITPNIIAMAAPSDRGINSFTTNHVDEITRFMTLKHDNKVMYYNLIGEADKWTFEPHRLGIVNHQFAFLDHSVPSISQMQAFCLSVKQWLESDVSNIAVIMCKSGRNRTAIMACAYLLYRWPQEFGTASEVIDYFSHRRMRRGQAVQQPCQRRCDLHPTNSQAPLPPPPFKPQLFPPNPSTAVFVMPPLPVIVSCPQRPECEDCPNRPKP